MKKILAIFMLGTLVFWGGFVNSASALTIMVGDNDGFGFGAANVPDGANLLNINLPEDRRIASEAAATNGAQQTDYYSSIFAPLPTTFDVVFSLPTDIYSGTLEIDMGGFQATTWGQLTVAYNGVTQTNLLNFQDGAYETAIRQFSLSSAIISSINAADEFRVTISRGNSTDGIAFDYFELTATPVPEPATMLLLGTGLVGVAGAARRRKKNKA